MGNETFWPSINLHSWHFSHIGVWLGPMHITKTLKVLFQALLLSFYMWKKTTEINMFYHLLRQFVVPLNHLKTILRVTTKHPAFWVSSQTRAMDTVFTFFFSEDWTTSWKTVIYIFFCLFKNPLMYFYDLWTLAFLSVLFMFDKLRTPKGFVI